MAGAVVSDRLEALWPPVQDRADVAAAAEDRRERCLTHWITSPSIVSPRA
jgi:hypothetical protein